jgi:Spy/CpxP family protein refolding chaperone
VAGAFSKETNMLKTMMAAVAVAGLSATNMSLNGVKAQRVEKLIDARVQVFLDDVDARPDQRERFKALEEQLKTDFVPVAKQGRATREELAAQWNAPAMDRIKVHQLVDAQIERLKGFADELADGLVSLHDVLTPEQRAKAAELRSERF